jgi:hypothetical protein
MKRFPASSILALIGVGALAALASAQESSNTAPPHRWRHGHGPRQFERCLSTVGLSADQQAAVQSIQSESKATLQADFAALKAAREKLKGDVATGADKSALGQDVLDQDASASKLKSDVKTTHDQIVAKLNPDQQNALATCMQQPSP